MANVITLRRRIKAAQNVSKTTRAMQMISASKLKRAQEAALSIRPYVEKLTSLSQNISNVVDENVPHPYLKKRNITNKTLLIALSPDKGLCGGLVTNLIREFLQYRNAEKNSEYLVIGKKIAGRIAHLGDEVIASFEFGNIIPTFDMVYPVFRIIDDYYLNQKVDSVKILSTHFTSIFSQTPKITTILPVSIPETGQEISENFQLFEPSVSEILPSLLKHYVEMKIYQHLLENFASEQASRMISMQNATNNANDMIGELKLEYNKSRQAKITNEILDISGGANINAYE